VVEPVLVEPVLVEPVLVGLVLVEPVLVEPAVDEPVFDVLWFVDAPGCASAQVAGGLPVHANAAAGASTAIAVAAPVASAMRVLLDVMWSSLRGCGLKGGRCAGRVRQS
jgi:hypothetical protein